MTFYVVLFLLGFIDRITKLWAATVCQHNTIAMTSWFSCSFALNRGCSWSLFHSESTIQFCVVTVLVMIVVAGIIWSMMHNLRRGYSVYGEWLVLVGAGSNVIDRFWYGGVVDFIVLHYHDWVWPLFNIADVMIVIGIMVVLYRDMRK